MQNTFPDVHTCSIFLGIIATGCQCKFLVYFSQSSPIRRWVDIFLYIERKKRGIDISPIVKKVLLVTIQGKNPSQIFWYSIHRVYLCIYLLKVVYVKIQRKFLMRKNSLHRPFYTVIWYHKNVCGFYYYSK